MSLPLFFSKLKLAEVAKAPKKEELIGKINKLHE
jgi:hypothetical protein